MTKFYRFTSVSLLIGLTCSIFFSYISANGQYYPLSPISTMGRFYYHHFSEATIMIIAILLWLMVGLLFYLTSFIYTYTDWSVTRTTFFHFICSYIGLLPIAVLAGWFTPSLINILIYTFYFVIIYIFIWAFHYWKNKRYVREINERLSEMRH
ncbi:DUF3021 domain-containing protein [Staphylococcus croceilyticus]|uniref:DUF3021 domain-containing protein n=1 Tax=Staphylococcus croceilyticus TaxID=319942 RepID=A0ABY2KB06_9STAP|nr:DUF3021 domain-containing protein [Staphylococcus croceilyticus]PNZ68194.1 DUF3021 domain-containing protein [Staphylococcus croceilyticus]TGA74350.1 DUF3021 domain-containing protein [Staphylococcus croceilyticus]